MSLGLAERSAGFLAARSDRRGFLMKAALVGSALVAAPAAFILRPLTAYAALCGTDSDCGSGYTVFCCSINRGMNKCPPGTFVAGWWKADDSPYCCGADGKPKARYYIDCNARCTCKTGCGDHFCSPSCVACSCRCGSGSCDQRRVCCNYFRYGQCHQEIGCSGPVVCRQVSCKPPYKLYDSCRSASLKDNRTARHSAPCLARRCT